MEQKPLKLILQEVNRLLETGVEEEVYQLTSEQIAGIEESKEQIKNGKFLLHDDATSEIEEWLKRSCCLKPLKKRTPPPPKTAIPSILPILRILI